MQRRPTAIALLVAAGLAVAVAGCEKTTPLTASSRTADTDAPNQTSFARFVDIPVPAGATMDLERSLVLGEREGWIGRLVMSVPEDAGRVYDFYVAEMPRFDWSPITSVRAATSVLTYSRGGRVATIQITGGTIRGAKVSMTVSPKGEPARAVTPGGAVETAPLR